jgi:HEPN domain-containing protein
MKGYYYMNHKQIAAECFRYAGSDIEVAKYLKKMIPCPLEKICYHCHQSTEKYLKGT